MKKIQEDLNQIEENKLKYLADYIKKETNAGAIIWAKSTKNILVFKLFSNDDSIKYFIISDENSIFNGKISKLYELNPQCNYKNNYFIYYDTKQEINVF